MKTVIVVPLSELTTSGEDGAPISPSEGDLVTVTTNGRVVKVQGEQAMVEVGPDSSEQPAQLLGEDDMERQLAGMYEESQRVAPVAMPPM
jgi:hypothetical protein